MLQANKVVKTFEGFRALDEATLTVPKGSVYGLVGPTAQENPPLSAILRAYTVRIAAR